MIWSDVIKNDSRFPLDIDMENSGNPYHGGSYFNWCIASGANNATALDGNPYTSVDPHGYCSDPTLNRQYQGNPNKPISLCYQNEVYFYTPEWTKKSKGNITNVTWYLPTAHDYMLAKSHGLTRILRNYSASWWTSSVYANHYDVAWIFNDHTGNLQDFYGKGDYFRSSSASHLVRCVALTSSVASKD
jgi:hypothetical protein